MSDRANNSLAALLTPTPAKGVQFSQAVVMTWDRVRGHNTLDWRGITITDIPFVEGVNPLVLKEGDVVGMLGWAPENAKGVGSWWILGKLTNPGDFVTDLTFNLGQIRFLTNLYGYAQAYFGSDSGAGLPYTALYYGDEADTTALVIQGTNRLSIYDARGHEVVGTDAASLNGLSRPYINYHIIPTFDAVIQGTVFVPSTTSATYIDLWEGINSVWHPVVSYGVRVSATGTAGWQILVDGTVMASGSATANGTFTLPGWGSALTPGSVATFTVQARNTGAGFTRLMVNRLYGRQT
jgi:hypothetical protein